MLMASRREILLSQIGNFPVQNGAPPEPPLMIGIGALTDHRRIRELPAKERYIEWQALKHTFLDLDALETWRVRAERNLAHTIAAGRLQDDPVETAHRHAVELCSNLCLVMAIAPDMHRSIESELVKFEGLEEFLSESRDKPALLLGDHLSAYQVAAMGVAACRSPVHMIALKRPEAVSFDKTFSPMRELGKLYIDSEKGNTIPPIMVPSATASVQCLRAMRRNERIYFNVDSDMGVSKADAHATFLGKTLMAPQALYAIALGAGSLFYRLSIARSGAYDDPAQHVYTITLQKLVSPQLEGLGGFHQERLDDVIRRLRRWPAAWSIWRYWDHDGPTAHR
jgi:lauroyl/myristoyl acyltransferase